MSLGCLWLGTIIASMNLANKSWNQLHNNIMSVFDDRLHATTSVYSTWIILANTAYQARVSGITGFRMDSFTPGGHSLPTDFTVTDTFRSLRIVLKCRDKSVGELARDRLTDLRLATVIIW